MLMAMTVEAFRDIYMLGGPKKKPYVYNYDSMLQMDCDNMRAIYPFDENMRCLLSPDDREFDIRYAEYLMSEKPFLEMVNMMLLLYNDIDVVILIGRDQESFAKQVLESYFKFIQQRYGVNVQYVYSKDDMPVQDQQTFSFNGLFFLDQDLQIATPNFMKNVIDSGMYKKTVEKFKESECHI